MTERNKGAEEITIFGETNFRNQRSAFGIKRDDRRRHMYIIGKTVMGKTTLLENMIISDIIKGEGCCYIDPHGDTAEKILDFIPNNRVNDLVYINPADMDNPIAFNIMEAVDENTKHLIASGLVGVFKKQFADSWGPRLEYILRNAILALLDYPGSTLLGVMRILVDKDFRKKVVEKIKDPVVKTFWTREFTQWSQ
ncbi:MAG: type IV secretion system DNA-binding domain-containing protein [bacterium]